jgi:hypothetical protein
MTLEQCFHLPHINNFNGPHCIFELQTNYNSYLPVPHIKVCGMERLCKLGSVCIKINLKDIEWEGKD